MAKILVAEDDKFLSNAYRVKLDKSGFDVVIARDGQEALDLMEKESPDILLLDLIMPNKDGFEVLQEMNDSGKIDEIPVIITSNLGQKEDIDKGKSLGVKDYIVKSDFSISDLVDKINSYL